MRCFLLYRHKRDARELDLERVRASAASLLAPLWSQPPRWLSRDCGVARWVWLDLPVKGFRPAFVEQDGAEFAFASEFPLNLRRLLPAGSAPTLRAFATHLAADTKSTLAAAIPPFCVVDGKDGERVRLGNDGLGQAQLFEYEDDSVYAVTNRVMLLRALSLRLRPDRLAWATRFVTGWFVGDTTGYAGVRYLAGGTQLSFTKSGIERQRTDVVGDWVRPRPMARAQWLELGRRGLYDAIADACALADKPSVGLSGGRDSRAIVACLRAQRARFKVRVRGTPDNYDVLVAAHLARIAGLDLHVKTDGGVPQASTAGCRASIERALLWQGGMFTTLKHKTFLAKAGRTGGLDGGVVNMMGQHGGIGKGDFAAKVDADAHAPEHYEERLLDHVMAAAPAFLRPELHGPVRERVRAAYRRAADYELTGRGPLHFFFLHEYTRRWGAATVNSQTGVVVAPFLSPDFVRACYAAPPEELPSRPLHRHITSVHAPDWAGEPFADDLTEADIRSGRIAALAPAAASEAAAPEWRQSSRHHSFDYRRYWSDVGRPLVEQALAEGGFWTELFDPDVTARTWHDFKYGPDLVALAHLLPAVLG